MTSTEIINFGAGPAKLPKEVLQKVQSELLSYHGLGMSVMEMSHRSVDYQLLNEEAIKDIRELMNIPDNYEVIFLQGGGTGMFAAIPLNLMKPNGSADYIVTGSWSSKAAKEASKYGRVNFVLPKADKHESIPDPSSWKLDPNASYVYYCSNETIHGIEFPYIPKTRGVPLVVDMSSNILSKEIDVSKFGVIFACAQKNIGPAGVTLVVIRKDLLGKENTMTPTILNFSVNVKENSIYNTPPTFAVYVMGLVFKWIKRQGGAKKMEEEAQKKSKLIYKVIEDSNGYYYTPVAESVRSRVTVTFRIGGPGGNPVLEKKFLEEAEKKNMFQLKGHRLVGGIRVSLYNAIVLHEVEKLADFMIEFYHHNS